MASRTTDSGDIIEGDEQPLLCLTPTVGAARVLKSKTACVATSVLLATMGLVVGIVLCWPSVLQVVRVGPLVPQKAEKAAAFRIACQTVEDEVDMDSQPAAQVLEDEHGVRAYLACLGNVTGSKEAKRWWLGMKMHRVRSIRTLRALHTYYSLAGAQDLFGGPYADQAEGQNARKVIEWGLHKYDGEDWTDYMNEEKATRKPEEGQVGVGSTASLISQVYPPNERFVILVLAWLPLGKYPWAGQGGVGAAHTHGQATCNFKFLNEVQGAGNTFYDVAGGTSKVTDMFHDGLPHKGGCKDHDYMPVLVNPKAGRQFIPSKDLRGATSGFIQDDYGAHSIDNLNTTHIAYSVHVYYPPYAEAWAFHEKSGVHGQQCEKRRGGGKGLSNCKHTFKRSCTTTSMKQYLKAAADLKRLEEKHREHKEEPESHTWYHQLCESAGNVSGWLRAQCKGAMQLDIDRDESLDE